MSKFILVTFTFLFGCTSMVMAQDSNPGFLTDFTTFIGLATVIVPAIVGFINQKLAKPMNKWVTYWVTFLVAIAVSYFSWGFGLGFPPANASWWIVLIDAVFVGLASTGIVSVLISEWLAKLITNKKN